MSAALAAAMPEGAVQPWTVLCVDDEPNILSALRRLLRPEGYVIRVADSADEGLQILDRERVDLVMSDMRMPGMDGAAFLERVRMRWPGTIRLLLTGHADIGSTIGAINRGEIHRYIAKPWEDADLLLLVRHALERKALEHEKQRLEALTLRQNEELRGLNASLEAIVDERTAQLKRACDALTAANDKLKAGFLTSIKVFSNLIELREGHLAGHSRRVADLARRIAIKMNLGPVEVQDVFLAGLLHEVGKIGLPDALLSTPVAKMDAESLGLYRKHPQRSEQALMALDELRGAARVLRAHQERFDGTGFPDGLAGLAIPVGSRVLLLAKDYESALLGLQTTRRATPEEAAAMIVQGRGKRYDPRVVDALIGCSGRPEPEAPSTIAVDAQQLAPGMVLARDLVTRDGVLLLAADFSLDASLVKQIREYVAAEGGSLEIYVKTNGRD